MSFCFGAPVGQSPAVKLGMAFAAEHQCFAKHPAHLSLPFVLPFRHVLQTPYVMDFRVSSHLTTILAGIRIEPLSKFGAAQRVPVCGGFDVQLCIGHLGGHMVDQLKKLVSYGLAVDYRFDSISRAVGKL